MTHKVHYKQTGSRLVQIRSMKNFNGGNYIRDLEQQVWTDVNLSNDPNEMWAKWKKHVNKLHWQACTTQIKKSWEKEIPLDH